MTTQSSVDRILSQTHLGLVGASRTGRKFGNAVLKELEDKGYQLSVVHPEVPEIGGRTCVPSIADLPEDVDALVVVVPPDQTGNVVREAALRGIGNIWMQQGSESDDAVAYCRSHGINAVHGECILMFARPAGLHKFHRWLWGIFGKLPKE